MGLQSSRWIQSSTHDKDLFPHVPFQHSRSFKNLSCLFVCLSAAPGGMWKFPSQRSNPCHSNDPSCCSDNAGSLTHYTTRELQACFFFKPTSTLNSAQRSSRCPSSAWEMWHFPRRCDKGIRSAAGTLLPNLTGERMVLPSSFRDDGRQTSLRWAEQRIN